MARKAVRSSVSAGFGMGPQQPCDHLSMPACDEIARHELRGPRMSGLEKPFQVDVFNEMSTYYIIILNRYIKISQ